MSTTTIAAVVSGAIIASLLLVYFNQWRRRNNNAKRQQIVHLSNQTKRFDSLARNIPSQYMDKKIHLMLVQAGTNALNTLKQLETSTKTDSQLKEFSLLAEKIKAGETIAPPLDPGNEQAAKDLRTELQSLFKFIGIRAKGGQLDKKYANQQLLKTQYFINKSLADAHILRANEAEKNQKPRVAIHHLHDAIAAFSKLASNPKVQEHIADYRQRIVRIEEQASQQSKNSSDSTPATTANNLSSQLEEMANTESEWKRKQDYED